MRQGAEWTFATGGIADCTDFSGEGGMEARGSTSTRSCGGAQIGAEFGDTKSIKGLGNDVAGGRVPVRKLAGDRRRARLYPNSG